MRVARSGALRCAPPPLGPAALGNASGATPRVPARATLTVVDRGWSSGPLDFYAFDALAPPVLFTVHPVYLNASIAAQALI